MPEYIEREALIEVLNYIASEYAHDGSMQCLIAAGTVIHIKDDVVLNVPTADVVEVRHGEWEKLDSDHFNCTQCGNIFGLGSTATIYNVKREWQYCPKCGAKTDGKGD